MDWQDRDSSYLAGTVFTRFNWKMYLPFPANSYKAKCASNLIHSGFTGQYGMSPFLSDAIEDSHYEYISGEGGGHWLEHGGLDGPHHIPCVTMWGIRLTQRLPMTQWWPDNPK